MSMSDFFRDYLWEEGAPLGRGKTSKNEAISYRILSDPYRKRLSIEKYRYGRFDSVIYDSIHLDFRKLQPMHQLAWRKEILSQTDTQTLVLIRDETDRAVFLENNTFENELCRSCEITTPQGIPVCRHQLFYTNLGDSFNGVILMDNENHPVMRKVYSCDDTGAFSELIKEEWKLNTPL